MATREKRITVLEKRHKTLEEQLKDLEKSPAPNASQIQEVKRQKLAVKDELASLQE